MTSNKLALGNKLRTTAMVMAIVTARQIQSQSPVQPPSAAAPKLEFEVASVKPIDGPPPTGGGPWTLSRGRFKADAAWVRGVIALAYGVLSVQVQGGPTWIDTERYDFIAKAESPDTGGDQIRLMLQSLLADRFKLVVHRETKDLPVYTLVVGKNGSKMQEANKAGRNYINWVGRGHAVFTEANMLGLINVLSGALGSPVIDKTGLTGLYNFELEYTDPRFQKPGGEPADAAPDIFGAVQEQLGLKLEAKKGPVEVLVIDHAEKASAN